MAKNKTNEEQILEAFQNLDLNKIKPIQTGYVHGINIENPEHLVMDCPIEGLKFEIMGGVNLKQLDRLKATLKVSRLPQLSPVHAYRNTVDLYNESQIKRYIRESAEKLELGTSDITNMVYSMIEGLEKYRLERRKELTAPKMQEKVILSIEEQREAKKLLENNDLLKEIGDLLKTAGLINEEDNGLLLFLIFLTRDFQKPLHALIHGSSGSGKSNLLKTVINCIPEENRKITTSITENSLYYPPFKDFWKHKILMLEDLDGALNALYILREFMSNGSISKLGTSMDRNSGDFGSVDISSEGPICIVGATTYEKIYEDNANRSYLIHVDESRKHQEDVMDYQNQMAAGLVSEKAIKSAQQLLQNIQRLLDRKIRVINPYQPELKLPQTVFKPLRSNTQYISLIQAITYLHQHQLEVHQDEDGNEFVQTTLEHIEWANKLCRESLLRKSDKLSGAKRVFFEQLKAYLQKNQKESFFTSDIAREFNLFREQVKRNIKTLENASLISRVGDKTKTGFEYKIESWDDYSVLNEELNVLDLKLNELKANEAKLKVKK